MSDIPDYKEMQQIPLFADFTEDEIYSMLKLAFVKKYPNEATLFVEGMKGEVLYVVKKGTVSITKKTDKGEVNIADLGVGECIGELSLIDDQVRSASARVAADSELVVITRKSFQEIIHADPRVANKLLLHFLRITAGRLRNTDKKFEAA